MGNPLPPPSRQIQLKFTSISLGTVSSVSLCPQSVALTSPAGSSVSVTLSPADLALGSTEVPAGAITVPEQDYTQVDVTLGTSCPSAKAMQVVNTSGTFSVSSNVTAHFAGHFSVDGTTGALKLAPQSMIDALASVSSNGQAQSTITSSVGQITTTEVAGPTFVQKAEQSTLASSSTFSTTAFAQPVTNGNLIVCVTWINGTQTVPNMTDTAGNFYTTAAGAGGGNGTLSNWRLETWYASGVTGGSNLVVTATLSSALAATKAITCHEYAGMAPTTRDWASSTTGTTANASWSSFPNAQASELVFAVAAFGNGAGSAGSGFTQRSALGLLVTEDMTVDVLGSYGAQFTNAPTDWISHVVTFKGL
jgi:hypothetical protein